MYGEREVEMNGFGNGDLFPNGDVAPSQTPPHHGQRSTAEEIHNIAITKRLSTQELAHQHC